MECVLFHPLKSAAFDLLNMRRCLPNNILTAAHVSSANLIHIEGTYHANSFPSGHCAHTVLYYGALLYLSFSEPVRTWRYRWLLIPLQLFAVLNILLVGFERIYQGEPPASECQK